VGTRAFAFHNREGLLEDKKWLALFPREVEPWLLALLLSSTPLRLSVERGARQLTGAQAIADIDCGVLAAVPFPDPGALAPLEATLRALHAALGLSPATVERERGELLRWSAERLERAAQVRGAIARSASSGGD
jgi:hypothetical protein